MTTRATEVIRLSNGDTMTLAEALDTGRVELRQGVSRKTGRATYTAWEAPDFEVGWTVGRTLYESRTGQRITARKAE